MFIFILMISAALAISLAGTWYVHRRPKTQHHWEKGREASSLLPAYHTALQKERIPYTEEWNLTTGHYREFNRSVKIFGIEQVRPGLGFVSATCPDTCCSLCGGVTVRLIRLIAKRVRIPRDIASITKVFPKSFSSVCLSCLSVSAMPEGSYEMVWRDTPSDFDGQIPAEEFGFLTQCRDVAWHLQQEDKEQDGAPYRS